MQKYILSICIPVHNRCNVIAQNIKEMLSLDRNDFDLIVSDSSDEGQDMTNYILSDDKRLRIIKFYNSATAMENWYNALRHADGKYCLHLNDRDSINTDYLCSFLDFLSNKELNGGICILTTRKRGINIYKNQIESVLHIPYNAYHPTGVFFNTNAFQQINDANRYFNKEFGIHPHDLILGILSKKGSMCLYGNPLWEPSSSVYLKNNKSGFHAKTDTLFFEPSERLRELGIAINELKKLNLPKSIESTKIKRMIKKYYWFSTMNYFYHLQNDNLARHYGMNTIRLSYKQKKQISLSVGEQFIGELRLNKNYMSLFKLYYLEFEIYEILSRFKIIIKRMFKVVK